MENLQQHLEYQSTNGNNRIEIKTLLPTAVTRNGEKCGKFTFIFRKKFYLSRKYAHRNSQFSIHVNVSENIFFSRKRKKNNKRLDSFRQRINKYFR